MTRINCLRQQAFLRALRTVPEIEIILGSFLSHDIMMPLAAPKKGYAKVIKTEEKGSDVNLATHMLVDAFRNDFELAVVVSNDSDLLEPIRVVSRELDKPVGILNPHKHPSVVLLPHVLFVKQIRQGVLAKSLFPDTMSDAQGNFAKPSGW